LVETAENVEAERHFGGVPAGSDVSNLVTDCYEVLVPASARISVWLKRRP